ncbi:peptide chain release factor aRF-1 [Halosimplex aquaticum]|uniref:Peptide chain release factor aRF-1 n=1 Tax=Halosimplex aquaticum TaxID=3026162 RepID=A0ABD5Y0F8_9EURY|nr:peptide chain release factor aRF-1 [Halosimplex aquaticum]
MSHFTTRDRIDRLESLDGDGTELVTLTVPAGKSLASTRERIAAEHAGAEQIRSDRTRGRVRRALDRVRRHLREYEGTPDCGLAVYAGVVEGDLISAVFDDLPEPITESTYRCDDRFHLDAVRETVAPGEVYGLVVVERGAAAVGRLVGDRVVPVRTLDSHVMGSSRAGGQSAKRFERERERQAEEFFQQVGDIADAAFLDDGEPVAGLVVGGSLGTAKQFVDDDYLDYRLAERVVGTYGVEYATEQGLHELVEAAGEELLDADARATRERLDEFFERLRNGDAVVYGDDVERAVEYGAVDTALVASTVDPDRREAVETAVAEHGGETLTIPTEFDRGARFAETFRVGALLRFPVE